jgi:hypothetical protein
MSGGAALITIQLVVPAAPSTIGWLVATCCDSAGSEYTSNT